MFLSYTAADLSQWACHFSRASAVRSVSPTPDPFSAAFVKSVQLTMGRRQARTRATATGG
ncbi:hypothetical protein GCM10028832_07760 [Streptomyces sparsus]